MFIVPPNNFTETSMWSNGPMFFEPPMTPLPNFDIHDETRQKPLLETSPSNQGLEMAPIPPVVNNPLYTQGWLAEHIGKYIKIEFLIGTSMWIDREGILKEVGISYFVIQESGTNDLVMCDIYSVKFVRIFSTQPIKCIP